MEAGPASATWSAKGREGSKAWVSVPDGSHHPISHRCSASRRWLGQGDTLDQPISRRDSALFLCLLREQGTEEPEVRF